MIIKIFISISSNTTQALAAHFDFTSFLSRPFFFFLVLGRSFFTPRVFLIEISLLFLEKQVNFISYVVTATGLYEEFWS